MDFLLAGHFSVVLMPFWRKVSHMFVCDIFKKRYLGGNPNKTRSKNICRLNRTS